jgi:hypothetical protein
LPQGVAWLSRLIYLDLREREHQKTGCALGYMGAPAVYIHTNLMREIYSHTFLWLAASRVEEKIKKKK